MLCTSCQSPDWISCFPGTAAEERVQGNLFLLAPAPEVPMRVFCSPCLYDAFLKLRRAEAC